MISMTKYWQQFKENIDNLPTRAENEEYTRQIAIANEMVTLGVTIELMNFTTISGVVAELQGKAKSYDNEVLYKQDKEYTFNLPKITTKESLVFAIAYYQHLVNYQTVSYQGSIFMFRGKVLAAVEDKKVITAIQAKALLGEIQRFCQSQNIIFNRALFLKQKHESAKEYIDRVVTIPEQLIPAVNQSGNNESEELRAARRHLHEIEERKGQLNIKAQNFYTILEAFNSCHNRHQTATLEWQNTGYILQLFYRILSWIYTPQIIENMEQAEKEFLTAEHDLHQELATHETVGAYIADLEEKRQSLTADIAISEEKIAQLLALAEAKDTVGEPEELSQPESDDLISEQNCEQSDEVDASAASHSEYYSFFKQHLPSQYVVNAVAVGAAAIVMQHLTYG
jgi:hypothetical protein